MQTTGIKVYMYFQWWHDCFCIIQEKNISLNKRLIKAYNITRLTSRNSTYKKISDFISELLVKYSKTNIFCAECFFACVSGVWLTVWRYVWQSPTNVWCKVTIITLWQASHPPVSSHAFLPMTAVINEITRILWLKTGNTNHTTWMSAVTDTKTKKNCKQLCFSPNSRRHFKVLSRVNTILVIYMYISDFVYT